uniref:Uncharacterized protein n=1 Tax=Heterorhabditis bacteriophora TaxID=37862 RepID=A0A1I7WSJ8_HETBA
MRIVVRWDIKGQLTSTTLSNFIVIMNLQLILMLVILLSHEASTFYIGCGIGVE